MSLRRAIRTVLTSLLAVVLVGTVGLETSPAAAGTVDDEHRFIQLINQTRAQAGLDPLIVDPELTAQARIWASSMAAADQLAHSPDIATGITSPWTVLGENVGVHAVHEPEQLYAAFVASPSHYQNLVDPRFRYVGVGVVNTSEGKIWTAHRFMATSEPVAATPPTTAAPPPTTVPPVRPPTKAPPTTKAPPITKAPPTTSPPPPSADPDPVSTPTTPAGTRPPTTTTAPTPPDATAAPAADPPVAPSDDDPGPDEPSDGRPAAGPGLPDITTVEDMLLGLIEAGI